MEVKKGDSVRSLVNYGWCVSGGTYSVYGPSSFDNGAIHVRNSEGGMGDILTIDEYEIIPTTTLPDLGSMMGMDMDSKQQFPTGAQRDTETGKSRPDLIPGECMLRGGHRFGMGAEHYGAHNFEKGIPSSRSLASLCRHLEKYKAGDESEDHLGGIFANVVFLMFNEENFEGDRDILDHPRYGNWTKGVWYDNK